MQSERNINKMKRQHTEWEKIFANDIANTRLISKTCKQFNIKKKKKTYKWPKRIWKDAQNHELLEKYKSKLRWAITSHWSEWMSSKSLQIINAGECVDKRNPLGGNVNWHSHYGEQYGSSLKNSSRSHSWAYIQRKP